MITNSVVEHYRSISESNLKFGQINIFAGKNASGKSNILDSLLLLKEFAESGVDHALGERHGIESVKQWSPSKPFHVKLRNEIISGRGVGYYEVVLTTVNKEYRIIEEAGSWFSHDEIDEPPMYRGFRFTREKNANRVNIRLFSPSIEGDQIERKYYQDVEEECFLFNKKTTPISELNVIEDMWEALNSIEAYNIFPNTIRKPQPPSRERRLVSDGGNLCSVFKGLQRTAEGRRRRKQIIELMALVIEDLVDIKVQNIAGLQTFQFVVSHSSGKNKSLNVSQVSDGTLRIFGIITAIFQTHGPYSIAIEEPEQTIHPGLLGIIADCINSRKHEKQFFITSHSPQFLEYFHYDDIKAVVMVGGESMIGPISKSQKKSLEENLFGVGELLALEGLSLD